MAIRISIFLSAAAIIGIGFTGRGLLLEGAAMALLLGAMTLGGGLLICGLFSLKMRWHGILGAGVLALLGVSRGVLNLPDTVRFFSGERPRGNAPALEFAVMLVCTLLLIRVWNAWQAERIRRLRDEP